jgi:Uma2 family endonuclease
MAVLADFLHRLTVPDYLRLVADAADDSLERTELVEGVLYDMSPESLLHARGVKFLYDALQAALPDHAVMPSGSVVIGRHSMWDPDVYVLAPDAPLDRHYALATDVVLVAEVSLTTRITDLGAKSRGYAQAGIAQYWVLEPQPGGCLLRHRQPAGDRFTVVDRFDLPGGFADLDVPAMLA